MDYHNADKADCFCSNTDYGYGICNNSDLCIEAERNHCLFASMLKRNSPGHPWPGVAFSYTEFNKFQVSSVNALSQKQSACPLCMIIHKILFVILIEKTVWDFFFKCLRRIFRVCYCSVIYQQFRNRMFRKEAFATRMSHKLRLRTVSLLKSEQLETLISVVRQSKKKHRPFSLSDY